MNIKDNTATAYTNPLLVESPKKLLRAVHPIAPEARGKHIVSVYHMSTLQCNTVLTFPTTRRPRLLPKTGRGVLEPIPRCAKPKLRRIRLRGVRIHGERRRAPEVLHAAEQHLDLPERHGRLPRRDHVAREVDKRPRQPALAVPCPQDALAAGPSDVRVGVERREQGLARLRLEPHLPAPRHVLDGQQGAVGEEDHVHCAVGDLDVARAVDDVGDRAVRGRVRAVAAREDGLLGADGPVHLRGRVDRLLHVCSVEVDLAAWRGVGYGCGEA